METQCKSEGSELCRLCLSSDRALASPKGVLWALETITSPQEPLSTSLAYSRLCWECRAVLQRLQRFKQQASEAQLVLNRSKYLTHMKCLSRLAVINKTSYDLEFVSDFETNGIVNDIDELDTKIFDPKIEIDIGDEEINGLDVWADPVGFDDPKLEEESLDANIACLDTSEAVETNILKTALVESRKASNSKRKTKKLKKHLSKHLNIIRKREKHLKPKVKKNVEPPGPLESCENCGGLRRRTKSVEAGIQDESDTPYKCVACNVAFKFEKSLLRHDKDKHSDGEVVAACSCTDNRPQLRREDKSNPKVKLPTRNTETGTFDCDVCGAKLKSDEYFRLHYEAHVSEKDYECATCGNVYKTRAQMFKHLIVHKPHRYLCHICGKSKLSMGSLNIHFLSHSSLEERPHKCNICSRTFITRDKLKIHSRFHDGVKPFKCTLCSSAFYVNFELTKHMKTNHSIGETEEKVKRDKIKRTISLCRNARMKQGEKVDDLGSDGEKINGKPKRKNDLTCDICGKTFAQKVCLDAHVVVHTGDRPFKCEECGQTFKFQSNVLTHAKSVHMVDKVHQCTICGARFKLKGNLTAHVKIHSGEKPFSCDICEQKFIRSRNLRNHYKVHAK